MSEALNLYYTPTMQIRSKSVLIYNKFSSIKRSAAFKLNAQKLGQRETYLGQLSEGAKKRMSKAIDLLISSTPTRKIKNPVSGKVQSFKLSFITLTLPQATDLSNSKESKLLLEKLLRHLRIKHNLRSYVWKAETQANGQIHYHITTDCYLHYQELRNYWNLLLVRSSLFDDYFKQRGNSNINSTDIHSVRNIKDLGAYLIKYFTKSYQNEKAIKGKVWDCSTNLKRSKYFEVECLDCDYRELREAAEQEKLKMFESEHCTIFKAITKPILNFIDSCIHPNYYNHMSLIYESG